MAEPLQNGIARLRGLAGQPVVGTGFLIAERHIMTCAHVVNDALGRSWDDPSHPELKLRVEFPFARHSPALEAGIVEWRPPSDGIATDIAVLELEQAVRARPYRTAAASPHRGQSFWTKGFPVGQDGGMDASGTLGTPIEFGRLLAQGNELPGFFIEGG